MRARFLVPGGRLCITDVTAVPDRLPSELTGPASRIACIADARPLDEYAEILAAAGLRTERHDHAITRMIDQIEAVVAVLRCCAATTAVRRTVRRSALTRFS
ncbi:hypothetical protein AB0N14_02060 [Streptomyces sp. NPDC051104]|uniref:hypothetical protein n=1 Tax=Streptomyces sp. NPDC051104 TaxID=3155044 RepID=UPI00342736ED